MMSFSECIRGDTRVDPDVPYLFRHGAGIRRKRRSEQSGVFRRFWRRQSQQYR